MPTQDLYPTASNHDGTEIASGTGVGDVAHSDGFVAMGNYTSKNHCLVKFPLPFAGWLSGKSVSAVTLTLTAAVTHSTVFNQYLYFEKDATPDNLVAGSGTYGISSRTKTTGYLNFGTPTQTPPGPLSDWTSGVSYSFTGDGISTLLSLLTEVTASIDPAVIDSLALIFSYQAGNGERLFWAFDNGASLPKLSLDYEIPATPSRVTTISETVSVIRNWSTREAV